MPVGVRLALRDLARYQARSTVTLAAISLALGMATAVIIGITRPYTSITKTYIGCAAWQITELIVKSCLYVLNIMFQKINAC